MATPNRKNKNKILKRRFNSNSVPSWSRFILESLTFQREETEFKGGEWSNYDNQKFWEPEMTSKNNLCKCTRRLFHDGYPQEQGPRHLLMPQAAYVDWPKIATASFHLRLLPLFPSATNGAPNRRIRLILLQRMSPIPFVNTSAFGSSAVELMNFQLLSLVLLYLLFFTSSILCAFSVFPAFLSTSFPGLWNHRERTINSNMGARRILHRLCSTLGKGNSTKSLRMFWDLWAVYCD